MKIALVEDHEPTRSRLVSLLSGQRGYELIHAVGSAEEALDRIADDPPDLVILDLGLPGLSGANAIRAIKAVAPSAEILIFTVMEEDEKVYAALKAGASGYLLKDSRPMEILSALEDLKSGGSPMSLSIARKVLKEFKRVQELKDLEAVTSTLSGREEGILKMLYEGDSYKEIANQLSLSTHTVHTHIKNIYTKLHVNSRAQAIYEALKKNILQH